METLERQRYAHENIERLEEAIVIRLSEETRTQYESLWREHEVAKFLNGIQQEASFLVDSYRDEDKYFPFSMNRTNL